ncbi:uncharacterized protein [Temnothorax longispinosus]|uniref:uncharacterized protein n=1 Tax=Temnothorax longispinosus TaxID=300112 RepID=UPI003A99701E
MNKGGKPKHSYWTEGGFSQKRNCKGKLIAQCKVCNKNLQNTAINRLKDHRKECRYDESSPDTPDPDSPEPESLDGPGPDQDHVDGDGIYNKIARKEDNQDHAYAIHEDQQLSVNPQFLQTCKKGAAGTSEIKKRQTKVKSFVDNVTSSER